MQENKATDKQLSFIGKNLFHSRNVLIYGEIDMTLAERVSGQLLSLSYKNNDPITIFINSPGGHVESGDTIFDAIRFISSPVYIIGTGWVASAGAFIYLATKKENRLSLPNTRYLLHQPHGVIQTASAQDVSIQAREMIKMRERINKIISQETGKKIDIVEKDTDRDFWMSAEEAIEYGVVGKIITSMKDVESIKNRG